LGFFEREGFMSDVANCLDERVSKREISQLRAVCGFRRWGGELTFGRGQCDNSVVNSK
jgi:hypothetical protein